MMTVMGKKLEDEAAGRQYETKTSMPSYSDLTARHPPSSSSPAFQHQPPEAIAPRSSTSWLEEPPPRTAPGKSLCQVEGLVQMVLLPASPRDRASDA